MTAAPTRGGVQQGGFNHSRAGRREQLVKLGRSDAGSCGLAVRCRMEVGGFCSRELPEAPQTPSSSPMPAVHRPRGLYQAVQ